MRVNLTPEQWVSYRDKELAALEPVLTKLGYALDENQLHIGGERYLMSGKKLVLTGTRVSDGLRVAIKASSAPEGKEEIRLEHRARETLKNLSFANDVLLAPALVYFGEPKQFTVLITAFIEQEKVFNARTLEEQFFLALRALEAQEGFHATTYGHEKKIQGVFPTWRSDAYLREFARFEDTIRSACALDADMLAAFREAADFLKTHCMMIERYTPYLAHTDLVPNNMRVRERSVYLIDYAALHFGNKYESWARFINYMLIHSPELARLLTEYVRTNRGEDEYLSLRLMRLYKIGFLLAYYAKALAKTTGDLHALTQSRIAFWKEALRAVLSDTALSEEVVRAYVETRNALRSKEESARQKELSAS